MEVKGRYEERPGCAQQGGPPPGLQIGVRAILSDGIRSGTTLGRRGGAQWNGVGAGDGVGRRIEC